MSIQLREYQQDIVLRGEPILKEYNILYLGMEVRTGKTITALSIAENYGAGHVLFLTKKKAVPSIEKDYKLLSPSYKLTVTNYEQASKLNPKDYNLIIIDEAQNFGAFPKPSKRTKDSRLLSRGKPIIYLSGTPSPENYSQLFHQFWISSFSPFLKYNTGYRGEQNAFYRWAKDFVDIKKKKINATQEVFDYSHGRGDEIWKHIKHLFILFSQEEAGFEAAVEEQFHYVDMSIESKQIYRDLEKDKLHIRRIPGREYIATVNSGADLLNKLSQISSGTLIFDDVDKGVVIDPSKCQYVWSRFFGKKIAILYKYKAELEMLKHFFPAWTDSPEVFNESTGLTFLGQIQSVREGTDLSSADDLVAINIDHSATSYFQMRARIQSKIRQGSAPMHWIFSKHGIEGKVYQAVSNKTSFTYSYYKKTNARKQSATAH
jgi:hypothetical protein